MGGESYRALDQVVPTAHHRAPENRRNTRISGAFSMPGSRGRRRRLTYVSHGNDREALHGAEPAEDEGRPAAPFDGVDHLVNAIRPEVRVGVESLGSVLASEHQLIELHVRAGRDRVGRRDVTEIAP